MCKFVWGPSRQQYGPAHMIKMIKAITEWGVSMEELLTVGESRLNMMRHSMRLKVSVIWEV